MKKPSKYVRKKKVIDLVSPEGKRKVLHQTEEESSNTSELVKEELFSHKTNDEEPGRLSISTTTSRKEKSNDMTRSSHRHRGHTVRYYEDDISPETDLGRGIVTMTMMITMQSDRRERYTQIRNTQTLRTRTPHHLM